MTPRRLHGEVERLVGFAVSSGEIAGDRPGRDGVIRITSTERVVTKVGT